LTAKLHKLFTSVGLEYNVHDAMLLSVLFSCVRAAITIGATNLSFTCTVQYTHTFLSCYKRSTELAFVQEWEQLSQEQDGDSLKLCGNVWGRN